MVGLAIELASVSTTGPPLCYIPKPAGIFPQTQIFGILLQGFTTNCSVRKREGSVYEWLGDPPYKSELISEIFCL